MDSSSGPQRPGLGYHTYHGIYFEKRILKLLGCGFDKRLNIPDALISSYGWDAKLSVSGGDRFCLNPKPLRG